MFFNELCSLLTCYTFITMMWTYTGASFSDLVSLQMWKSHLSMKFSSSTVEKKALNLLKCYGLHFKTFDISLRYYIEWGSPRKFKREGLTFQLQAENSSLRLFDRNQLLTYMV